MASPENSLEETTFCHDPQGKSRGLHTNPAALNGTLRSRLHVLEATETSRAFLLCWKVLATPIS